MFLLFFPSCLFYTSYSNRTRASNNITLLSFVLSANEGQQWWKEKMIMNNWCSSFSPLPVAWCVFWGESGSDQKHNEQMITWLFIKTRGDDDVWWGINCNFLSGGWWAAHSSHHLLFQDHYCSQYSSWFVINRQMWIFHLHQQNHWALWKGRMMTMMIMMSRRMNEWNTWRFKCSRNVLLVIYSDISDSSVSLSSYWSDACIICTHHHHHQVVLKWIEQKKSGASSISIILPFIPFHSFLRPNDRREKCEGRMNTREDDGDNHHRHECWCYSRTS